MVIDSSPKIKDKKYQKMFISGKKGQKGAKWPRNNKILVLFEWTYKLIITWSKIHLLNKRPEMSNGQKKNYCKKT